MRIWCVRFEAYDLANTSLDLNTQFTVLPSLAEGKPHIAKAMLQLLDHLQANKKTLQDYAKG